MSAMSDLDLQIRHGGWWVVTVQDGDGTWRVAYSARRTRATAEQLAANLNRLGSTRERGLRYAAASLAAIVEAIA